MFGRPSGTNPSGGMPSRGPMIVSASACQLEVRCRALVGVADLAHQLADVPQLRDALFLCGLQALRGLHARSRYPRLDTLLVVLAGRDLVAVRGLRRAGRLDQRSGVRILIGEAG